MELQFNDSEKILEKFTINFKDQVLKVQRMYISSQVIFHITFPSGKIPLVLTRATSHTHDRFWTSIPQGRQKEAEEIGPLIAEYILSVQS